MKRALDASQHHRNKTICTELENLTTPGASTLWK